MALPTDLQQQYDAYMADPSKGIPIPLLQYAQANPSAGIDTSGNGLKTTDAMYNFYNPLPGQTQGVNWFYADDRNNPNLAAPTAATPQNISQLSSTQPTSPLSPTSLQTVSGGAPTTPARSLYNPTGAPQLPAGTTPRPLPTPPAGGYGTTPNTGSTGLPMTPPPSAAPSAPATPAPAPAAPYDFSGVMSQYGLNQPMTNAVLPVLQNILNNMNNGLSPQVLSAMRSQATSAIPGQYDQAAMALRSQLLRNGAIGAGELPASAADVIRNFAPLEQARNQAIADANRQTILANQQEIARNQGLGMQAIGDVLQGQQLANQYNLGTQSNDTQRWVASLNSDTQKWVSQLSADTQSKLAQLSATTQTNLANLDADTRIKIAQLETAPGSLRNILLAGLFGTLGAGVGGGKSVIGDIIGLVTGASKPSDPASSGGSGGTSTGGTIAGSIGGAVASAAGAVGSAASSLGSAVAGLMTNPITIGIGAAIGGAIIWLKSQAHWEANTWVQQYQNPFDQNMDTINQQFNQLAQSGQLTKAQGQQIIQSAQAMIKTYEDQMAKFASQGSDEKTVAGQAAATEAYWYGPGGSKYLQQMQDVVNGLQA